SSRGTASGNLDWATLWLGSAASAVLLNPTGFSTSTALGIAGTQQVGWGLNTTANADHALLWSGTASSAVDLNPTNLSGFTQSYANGTNGAQQVGQGIGTGSTYRAMLWSGSASSAVNLHLLLPATGTWTESDAYTIDNSGNVFGIASGT